MNNEWTIKTDLIIFAILILSFLALGSLLSQGWDFITSSLSQVQARPRHSEEMSFFATELWFYIWLYARLITFIVGIVTLLWALFSGPWIRLGAMLLQLMNEISIRRRSQAVIEFQSDDRFSTLMWIIVIIAFSSISGTFDPLN